jgi:ankyrin repeat protein
MCTLSFCAAFCSRFLCIFFHPLLSIDTLPIPGADTTAAAPETQDTALHLCCRQGMNAVVQALLQRGASPHSTNVTRQTPADVAAQCGHVQLAQSLQGRLRSSSSILRLQQLRDRCVLVYTVPAGAAAAGDSDASSNSLEYTETAADELMQQQELYAQYSAAHAGASARHSSSALMAAVLPHDNEDTDFWYSDDSDAGSDTDDNGISGTTAAAV